MDDKLEQRLAAVEAKLDRVIEFTDKLDQLFGAFMTGGKGRLAVAAAKLHRQR
jgi:hypothetical protein